MEPDVIRLIILQPSEDLESPLWCELITTTLTHCEDDLFEYYIVLSYVWGDISKIIIIITDNHIFPIIVSLDPVFRHLRETSRTRKV
jgi:hypothetical protein